ncbi:MAG: type II secretion system protein [Candidatus Saccharimonadales bacterium]
MKRTSGFTIVELLIVIAILGILLTLVVVNLSSSQVSARDDERKVDIANIASNLETFYTSGTDTLSPGSYPGVDQLSSESNFLLALRDLNPANLRAPGYTGGTISLVPATNNNTTTTGVTPQPTPTQYVYQPLSNSKNAPTNGGLCNATADACRQYILYYMLESTGTVVSVKSKNQ